MTWQKIADELAAQIQRGELTPGSRIQSEEELSTRLTVSRHTAHRALNELQRLGLVVRQRRWGTVVADRSQTQKRRIAYLVDFTGSRFQSDIIMHIEHALGEGERLVMTTSKNDPEREAENLSMLQDEVDGIICYPADGDANGEVFRRIADTGYPLVLVDRAPRGCEDLVVLTDNVQASERGVRHLVEAGHRRIAFFGRNNDQTQSARERYQGYRNVVDGLGYATRPYERWIPFSLEEDSPSMLQAIADALVAMRTLPEPPTAAFCTQDRLAMGLMDACSAQGLEIGIDFGIATYNDFGPLALRQHWRVDRILQQVDQISVAAMDRLHTLMRGEKIDRGPIRIPAKFAPAEDARALLTSSFSTSSDVA